MACIATSLPLIVQAQTTNSGGYDSLANEYGAPIIPGNPLGLDVVVSNGKAYLDDRAVVLSQVLSEQMTMESTGLSLDPGDGGTNDFSGDYNAPTFTPADYGTNLWLEITNIDTNSTVFILAHNTQPNVIYELLSETNLVNSEWKFEQEFRGMDSDTNTALAGVDEQGRTNLFFWALHPDTVVHVASSPQHAIEPFPAENDPGQVGTFFFSRDDYTGDGSGNVNALTILYSISGTASNGVDYVDTNGLPLSGSIVIPAGSPSANLDIFPLADNLIEGPETVTLTLTYTNRYFNYPSQSTATVVIDDNHGTNVFQTVAYLPSPRGIDWSEAANALIVSVNYDYNGSPNNFDEVFTNITTTNSVSVTNTVLGSWSTISNLTDEVKLVVVKQTANGFTNGDIYFGTGVNGVIGWMSADGIRSNLNWAVLTTNVEGTDTLIRGSLCFDQSGNFGGDLIAVMGNNPSEGGGVWRINSSGQGTLITNLPLAHLEGVITLPNDSAKWGPWAGKIITGGESTIPPQVYAIDTNGVIITNIFNVTLADGENTYIGPEDFDIIPTNQDLYCLDEINNSILKVPSTAFVNNVGDLLITKSGDGDSGSGALFTLHWNQTTGKFEIGSIIAPNSDWFEHVTFAPISLKQIP